MIKTVIIDDEKHAITNISTMLQKFDDVKIEYTTTNPEEAIQYLVKNETDLVFLDIKMPGQTGFDVLDKLNKLGVNSFNIIFLTAYDEFAIKAIKYSAFDYLLKPVDKNELQETINKLSTNKDTPKPYDYAQLLDLLQTEAKIKINTANGFEFLNRDDIAYAHGEGNYTELILTNKETRIISKTLKDLTLDLDDRYFVRVHKSYLLNKKYIKEYNRKDRICLLKCNLNEFLIPVSTRLAKNISDL
jgi:two-component system LytT family response regulator